MGIPRIAEENEAADVPGGRRVDIGSRRADIPQRERDRFSGCVRRLLNGGTLSSAASLLHRASH
jgi:hypothetical protein